MAALKADFAGVSKHFKPTLEELVTRTEQPLCENHSDEPVIKKLTKDLENNLEKNRSKLLLETNLKVEQLKRERDQIVGATELAYQRKAEGIRTEMLAHAKLDFMTAIHEQEASEEEKRRVGPNLGQGPSNDRNARKALDDGRSTAYHIETRRRQNEDFYLTTDKIWEHWMKRLDALGPKATAQEMQAVVPQS